ncbi:EF-Tu/IF-2/RF-3 family GTPase [Ruania rhizosphaerae]|uniref:EF-Tu/IF-2/RF-3 family GTPase n=1 Tax=Ruania rhizosphaerae TaxID=1840413 RepID=UPI001359EEAB|nr:EF-Tu/IF-2/RF-3 family GTPase [Ruania rhizosphaerae]
MFWRRRKSTDPATSTTGPAGFTAGSLTVESVFTITGRGTVVAGTVDSGSLAEGQHVTLLRSGQVVVASRITGVEMFRQRGTVAEAGAQAGLLLEGVDRTMVEPGDVVVG